MGQKIHPKIFRIGVIYSWGSKWFGTRRTMPDLLREDFQIRSYLEKKLKEASVDRVEIERTPRAVTVTVHTAKPGFVIGRGGTGVESLKLDLKKIVSRGKSDDQKRNLNLNIIEVTKPSLSANIVLQSMIADIERRVRFRHVMKLNLDRVQKAGAKGVKMMIKGRLNGAEIAREEKLAWGSIPLHNLRADIDFAQGTARTIFGAIGIKVWIYRGEVFIKNGEVSGQEKLGEVVSRTGKV
ncbi:30S ribosomal protein S3 [Candidatus Uhrbacteria bacterium RIFOXYC2_FULL_47_19]|uniref:Small ribosomal subunit protein uS3 n=1 Tax=Candidatus Uhrbacteria bacterium RIFOXYC2_FULL_47_19 TaxID=1802424 RepID=A0A1F7WER8_9BACT|nr:MAG: 30S ribosomal protein S3 [Candidatus Uhrbacteria bacterium RIFOXYC2_FULL_47_19]